MSRPVAASPGRGPILWQLGEVYGVLGGKLLLRLVHLSHNFRASLRRGLRSALSSDDVIVAASNLLAFCTTSRRLYR